MLGDSSVALLIETARTVCFVWAPWTAVLMTDGRTEMREITRDFGMHLANGLTVIWHQDILL